MLKSKKDYGQSVSETIILLPFFLLLVFGLLQLGQLATALLVANYGASAIARQVVQDGGTGNQAAYEARFQKLLTAGMKNTNVTVDPASGLLANVTVHACAEIDAFPFVGQFLGRAIVRGLGSGTSNGCQSLSVFAYNTSPPRFIVHGKATARMNYRP